MIVSTAATTTLEAVAAAAPDGIRWFQLYVTPVRSKSHQKIHFNLIIIHSFNYRTP